MDACQLFLDQHGAVHSAAVGGNKASAAERAFAGLSDEQMRVRPREDLNSLAWLMWHIARAEDIMVNTILHGRDQVCDDAWRKRLGVSRRDFGIGMTSTEVTELTRQVDLAALRGVIAAMAVPFLDDYKVDEDNLARFAVWLAGCRGVTAVMTNGHTGEVGSLLPDERATVTRVVADAVKGAVRVVSAVCAEGTFEAVEHARAAAHAGADTVDVMPCHMWLRFGVKEDAVYEYVKTIGGESGLDVIVHVYPTSTRAAYSTRLMVRLASIPQVKGFKMGERDLGAYERDIRALRADAPHVSLLNCMDEYLFATFVHRLDGTLVGCASLVPELINGLFEAMAADDLTRAREINERLWPIKEAVYGTGEPSGDAHARMKEGMALRGIFRSALARPPGLRPSSAALAAMQAALVASRVPVVDLV